MTPAATTDQRSRILATALDLMGEQGAPVTSMRQLADACSLNVATLYHYFPSKAELIQAVIDDRRYLALLAEELPPIDRGLAPAQRMTALLEWLWRATLQEEALIRLLLSESLRAEPGALETVATMLDALASGFERWLDELFPDLEGDRAAVARVLRGQLFALMVESLVVPPADRPRRFDARSRDLAALLT